MPHQKEIPLRPLPANFGPTRGAQTSAEIIGPCGDTMKFWLSIEACRIVHASFTTDGCNASIASGAMTAAMIEGKSLDEARQFTPDEVLRALGGLPADHVHCPILAVKTLKAAIENYRPEQNLPGNAQTKPGCASRISATPDSMPATLQPHSGHGLLPKHEESVQKNLRNVAFKLVVLSGKGGVGKSTIAANLAVALAAAGKHVGLLDVDVHGPSIPKILGIEGVKPELNAQEIQPICVNNRLKTMSLGLLLNNPSEAVIWRGPMKYGAIQELLSAVAWGELDVLIVDAPPGTGDEPLAVAQLIGRPAAAIVVTTPQQLAVADVRRSITFCKQVSLPILGLIENMSGFYCPQCGKTTDLFKSGGGASLAQEMSIPFLGNIPIDSQIIDSGDNGTPFVSHYATNPSAIAFAAMAKRVLSHLPLSKITETKNKNTTKKLMKIAIPLTGGRLAGHFGHCEQFAIVDADPNTNTILHTTLVTPPPHEPGLLPRWLREQGVQIVIAGGIGQRALTIFAQNEIEVRAGHTDAPVKQLVTGFLKGQLQNTPSGCAHHDHDEHHSDEGHCHSPEKGSNCEKPA